MLKIIEESYFSFEYYKQLVEKYEEKDCREINFQNRIILPMLEKIFIDNNEIDIVDVSTQYKNKESFLHTRKHYANKYTPDLLIVKDWNYANKDIPKENYLAVVEIKSPILDSINNDNKHTNEEVKAYIANGSKVILTDCYSWVFYGFGDETITFTLREEKEWKEKEWDKLLSYIKDILKKISSQQEKFHRQIPVYKNKDTN